MKRETDIKMSHNGEKHPRSSHSRERERELERKRREWMIAQERARDHERRKQKMIREYEERRARELGLKSRKGRSPNRSHSKHKSRSRSRSRSHSPSTSCTKSKKIDSRVTKTLVMSEKLATSSSNSKLFKGPDGTKIPVSDLKKIKVDIRRNIEPAGKTKELQRNIVNPDEVVLKRREGEGAKPLFEREELKQSGKPGNIEIEEHRTVITIDADKRSSRRSVSVSPERRHRIRSPRRDSRHETSSRSIVERVNHHRNTQNSSERSRDVEVRERSRDRNNTREYRSPDQLRREYERRRSHSEEHNDRRRPRRDASGYELEQYEERSRRYVDDSLGSRRIELRPHYIQAVPVPIYYDNYARPIIVDPMMPMRGPIGMGRGRMPPMMGMVRPPYPPRFIPPVMFRSRGPPNTRF